MRLLLSFVNSSLTLGGFDWDTGEMFWQLGADRLRACGICYHRGSLLVASDDSLHRFATDRHSTVQLPGPHPSLAHSVHPIGQDKVGVSDPGNSVVRLFSESGQHIGDLAPLSPWPEIPRDAIHLNDFVDTPHGVIASCFDFRPWRSIEDRFGDRKDWETAGLGLLLNLSIGDGCGRIIACGVDHPHSVTYQPPYLYHCSSTTGTQHCWEFTDRGMLRPVTAIQITREHFLRGACMQDKVWFLGGSTTRHTQPLCDRMAIYRFDESANSIDRKLLPDQGEIYDVLPWDEEIMRPLINTHFPKG